VEDYEHDGQPQWNHRRLPDTLALFSGGFPYTEPKALSVLRTEKGFEQRAERIQIRRAHSGHFAHIVIAAHPYG